MTTPDAISELVCKRPDHDVPGLMCGYPLPCPWHTLVISEDAVVEPIERLPRKAVRRAIAIAGVIYAHRNRPIIGEEDLFDW